MSYEPPQHKFHDMLKSSALYESKWRTEVERYYDFYDGNQWTDGEKAILEERKQQPVVLNMCRPTVDQLYAMYAERRSDIQVIGRNPDDEAMGTLLTELLKHVYDENEYAYYEGHVFRQGVTGGVGWFEMSVSEVRGENQIGVNWVPFENVFWDPYMRKEDGSDARYIIKQAWMDVDVAKKRWPGKADELQSLNDTLFSVEYDYFRGQEYEAQSTTSSSAGFSYYDSKNRRVAIYEVWYKDDENNLKHVIFSDNVFLKGSPEEDAVNKPPLNIENFPLVPFFAGRDKDGLPAGIIKYIITIQESINKLYSKWQWNVSSKQMAVEEGATADIDLLKEEIAKPDGVLVFEEGALMNKQFMPLDNIQESAHLINMMSMLTAQMGRTSGVNDAVQGIGGVNARSNQQEQSRLLQGASMQTSMLQNMLFSKKQAAKVIMELMGAYYTEPRIIRITQPNETFKFHQINEEFTNPETGETIIYDMDDILNYDVVLKHVAAYSSVKEYTTRLIMDSAAAGVIPPEIASKVLIRLIDIPHKEELLAELDQLNQQNAALAQVNALKGVQFGGAAGGV